MAGQGEAIHLESAVRLLVNIKMAFIPRWREIVGVNRGLMEKMARASVKERQDDIGIVTGVDLVAGDLRMLRGNVATKIAEVAVE